MTALFCASSVMTALFCASSVTAVLFCASPAAGQTFEDLYIVDSPTAGLLWHGGYLFQGSIGPDNSLLFGVQVGFHDRLMLGMSFGFQEFIGRGDVSVNDKPGFQVRVRLLEESEIAPALALGIDTQGEGFYFEEAERYEFKSKGFYGVVSKNYALLSAGFSLHGGVNYSLENKDEDGINIFGGFILELFRGFSVLLDYNAALDDNDDNVPSSLTRGRGYLDTGLRFDFSENFRLKILFKDLLDNYKPESGVARTIEMFYANYF